MTARDFGRRSTHVRVRKRGWGSWGWKQGTQF